MIFRRKSKTTAKDGLQFRLFDRITIEVPASFSRRTRILKALQDGRYEAEEARAMQRNLQPTDRLLDLGSGIGVIASLAAQIIPAENITCVEANADLLEVIRANLGRNNAAAATVLHGAVCSAPVAAEVDFHIGQNFTAASLSAEGRGQFETHQVPALNFADVLELSRPTVITCDVEGAELDLMDTILPSSVWFVCVEVHLVWLGERGIQQFFEKMHRQGFAYHPRGSAGGIVCFKRLAENAEA